MGSEYNASSRHRRDARASKDEAPQRASVPGRKDRRRWCRGKVGRDHTIAAGGKAIYGTTIRMDVCTTCGKQFW
jgi:hypothetical protein